MQYSRCAPCLFLDLLLNQATAGAGWMGQEGNALLSFVGGSGTFVPLLMIKFCFSLFAGKGLTARISVSLRAFRLYGMGDECVSR